MYSSHGRARSNAKKEGSGVGHEFYVTCFDHSLSLTCDLRKRELRQQYGDVVANDAKDGATVEACEPFPVGGGLSGIRFDGVELNHFGRLEGPDPLAYNGFTATIAESHPSVVSQRNSRIFVRIVTNDEDTSMTDKKSFPCDPEDVLNK
jgi:hypothetical protein